MSKLLINGGRRLNGVVDVMSAKNSILPLLAGSILTEEKVVLHNCPKISDVENMIKILLKLGCDIQRDGASIIVDSSNMKQGEIPSNLAKELRSSIFLLGPMLSRLKIANVAYPGGCEIGLRPIDIHLKGLRELNISVIEEGGYIYCDSKDMQANDILLDIPSVGATENLMMASVRVKGRTILRNVAKEPEIVDLQNFLNKMGAKIQGAGSSVIVINGVDKLHGIEFTPIGDRIVAGTFMIATVMCGGDIELHNINSEYLHSLISKFSKSTCNIHINNDIIRIKASGAHPKIGKVDTMYYPGFPTDLQSQITALATVCDGTTIINENIFETRFKQVPEFCKMGAKIQVKDRTAIVEGVKHLHGAEVVAEDLRGGASLVLMGLKADKTTVIDNVFHIDRGYENIEKILSQLGADITRI